MKTVEEIHDLIQTCDLYPDEDSMRRVLEILEHLNKRLAKMEGDIAKLENVRERPKD